MSGLSIGSAARPSGPMGARLAAGSTMFPTVPGKRHTCLAPERLPRFAIGWPSISMMSSANESTGALAMPTGKVARPF